MKISLTIKKRILSLAAMTIVVGNVARVAIPSDRNDIFKLESEVYAETSLEADIQTQPVQDLAYEAKNEAAVSQKMEDINLNREHIRKIREYLDSRGAPLADYAYTFEKMAVKYDLPYNLMPAISIIESSGGLYNYRPYNYAGMGGQGGGLVFNSYEEAIEKHAQILRYGYFDKGADTPEEIEKYYCYMCPTWGEKVTSIMNAIEAM